MLVNWRFIRASFVLTFASMMAFGSHYIAHEEQIFEFTIIGFTSAIFGGMYYGLRVPFKQKPQKMRKQ